MIIELNRHHVPVVRLEPGDFPQEVNVSGSFDGFGLGGSLATATRVLDLGAVRSVYWRRPTPYRADLAMDEQTARWAVEEARYGLGGTLAALPGALPEPPLAQPGRRVQARAVGPRLPPVASPCHPR